MMFWTKKDCGIFISGISRKMGNYLENIIAAFIFYYLRHRDCSRIIECSMTNVGCRKKGWVDFCGDLACCVITIILVSSAKVETSFSFF